MNKVLNTTSIILGTIGGFIVQYLGGWDMFLRLLIFAIVLDYLSGVLKAIYNKKLSSEIGFKGICKKVFILLIVAASFIVQQIVGESIPIREIVICFFVANELISLLENAVQTGLPIPDKLKELLLQIRDRTKADENTNTTTE